VVLLYGCETQFLTLAGRSQTEAVGEESDTEDIWTYEERSNRILEENNGKPYNLYSSPNIIHKTFRSENLSVDTTSES
jgi:hypothetical protein